MSRVPNLLVLVIYVLGAHVLPAAHPFLHHYQHPHQAAIEGTADTGVHCCAGHHHVRPVAAKSSTCVAAADCQSVDCQSAGDQRVETDSSTSHRCGETCALGIASHSPVGAGMGDRALGLEPSPPTARIVIESRPSPFRGPGCLPEQRGPPVASCLYLMAA